MGLDRPETCRGWRNTRRISCASSWLFFTRLHRDARWTKHRTYTGWSKSIFALDDCIVIVKCTETLLSPCRRRSINNDDQDRDLSIVTFSKTQAVFGLFVLFFFGCRFCCSCWEFLKEYNFFHTILDEISLYNRVITMFITLYPINKRPATLIYHFINHRVVTCPALLQHDAVASYIDF
jgi:hypothetical protein